MALLLELIFIAYLLVRAYGGPGSDKLAAAVGLFGMAVSPFVYVSVNIWRTIHPLNTVVPSLRPGMSVRSGSAPSRSCCCSSSCCSCATSLAKQQATLDDLYLAEDEGTA